MKSPTVKVSPLEAKYSLGKKFIATKLKHTSARKCKTVSFKQIEWIEFAYTVGDNPSCTGGVPLACGGDILERLSIGVDYFEKVRPRRRSKRNLILSKSTRRSLLLDCGHGTEELDCAAAEAKRLKMERISTLKQIGVWQKLRRIRQH